MVCYHDEFFTKLLSLCAFIFAVCLGAFIFHASICNESSINKI